MNDDLARLTLLPGGLRRVLSPSLLCCCFFFFFCRGEHTVGDAENDRKSGTRNSAKKNL